MIIAVAHKKLNPEVGAVMMTVVRLLTTKDLSMYMILIATEIAQLIQLLTMFMKNYMALDQIGLNL